MPLKVTKEPTTKGGSSGREYKSGSEGPWAFSLEGVRVLERNVGALIIRIGFWEFFNTIIVQYTPNPILMIKAPILFK